LWAASRIPFSFFPDQNPCEPLPESCFPFSDQTLASFFPKSSRRI
jgi:hypothetical protein